MISFFFIKNLYMKVEEGGLLARVAHSPVNHVIYKKVL